MTLAIIIGTLTLGGVLLSYLTSQTPTNPIPEVSEDEPLSTLACENTGGKEALADVLEAYEAGGDRAAYATAQTYIDSGVCQYSTAGLRWARPGSDLPGVEPYMEVQCTQLNNGYCIAVQPVYGTDALDEEIAWSGYMLVRPRDESDTPRPSTVVSRTQKGLVLDLNF